MTPGSTIVERVGDLGSLTKRSDNKGLGNLNRFFAGSYGEGLVVFFELLDAWRSDGRLADVNLR